MNKEAVESFSNFFIERILTKKEVLPSDVEYASNRYYLISKNSQDPVEDEIVEFITGKDIESPHFSKDLSRDKLLEIFSNNKTSDELSLKLKNSISLKLNREEGKSRVSKREARILTSWGNIKKLFRDNVDFCVIKEAIGWIDCYINSPEFSPSDIHYHDRRSIDMEQTLKTITRRINDISLTQDPPFDFRSGKLSFYPAKSGEIDVVMWSEKNQKIMGSSVTRDRGTIIEGNQFFRHWLRVHNVSKELRASNERLNAEDVRQKLSNGDNNLNEHHNDGGDFNYNWLKAQSSNSKEFSLSDLLFEMKESSDYVFYGEIFSKFGIKFFNEKSRSSISNIDLKEVSDTEKDLLLEALDLDYNNVSAGLNSLSYNRNFTQIGAISFTERESRMIKSSLKMRYNGIDNDQDIELDAKKVIMLAVVSGERLFDLIGTQFSEGVSYREERSNFINSINNLITEYSEYESDLEREQFINEYFKGFKASHIKEVKNALSSKDNLNRLEGNIQKIEVAQSEVPTYMEGVRGKIKLLRESIDKKQVMDFLKKLEEENPSIDGLSNIQKLMR